MLARQPVLHLQQFVAMIRQQSKHLSENTLKVHSSATDSSQIGPTAHHDPEMLARQPVLSLQQFVAMIRQQSQSLKKKISNAFQSSQSRPTAHHAPEMLARQPVLSLQQFVAMIRQQSKHLSENTLKVHFRAARVGLRPIMLQKCWPASLY
jgi:hypothetical protein